MSDLKPCPNVCCKSEPKMYNRSAIEKVPGFIVICAACGWNFSDLKPTKAEAIATWNQRPDDPRIELARKVAAHYDLDRGIHALMADVRAMAEEFRRSRNESK